MLYCTCVFFILTKYHTNQNDLLRDIMKFFDQFFPESKFWFINEKITKTFLFETSGDLQPIMRFNIISRSKRYSLFPILSGLIKPSLRNFRISLSDGLFSPVGIGGSIPSLRTVLETFLPHTAPQSILLVSFLKNRMD